MCQMPRGHFDRTERKAQTRTALLEAAARVYALRGFAGATLDDVAEEAGFTKGAVYAHFGSKAELLQALMQEYLAAEIAEQVALFDTGVVSWQRPIAGSNRFMEQLEDSPDAFRLLIEFWLLAQRDAGSRERMRSGLEAMRATFAGFVTHSGAESPQEARNFASLMVALSIGLGMLRLIDDEVPPGLLGQTFAVLIRAAEQDPEAAQRLTNP